MQLVYVQINTAEFGSEFHEIYVCLCVCVCLFAACSTLCQTYKFRCTKQFRSCLLKNYACFTSITYCCPLFLPKRPMRQKII